MRRPPTKSGRSAARRKLENPLLMGSYYGLKQSMLIDATILNPHAGEAPATVDNAEGHIGAASLPAAGDFITAANSGPSE